MNSVARAMLRMSAVGNAAEVRQRAKARQSLQSLNDARNVQERGPVASLAASEIPSEAFAGRLGRAGFMSPQERRFAHLAGGAVVAVLGMLGALLGTVLGETAAAFGGMLSGIYCGFLLCWWLLQRQIAKQEREALFMLPLLLEEMILLVEAGMGVLPALGELVRHAEGQRNCAVRVFLLTYRLSAGGIPFRQALESVAGHLTLRPLRHVLLHLDVSASQGGSLVPSLRSLSDHAHTEWRLSVEQRVKRLEGQVVFPVFVCVLGLLLLTAAVPLLPILEFNETLAERAAERNDALERVLPSGGAGGAR